MAENEPNKPVDDTGKKEKFKTIVERKKNGNEAQNVKSEKETGNLTENGNFKTNVSNRKNISNKVDERNKIDKAISKLYQRKLRKRPEVVKGCYKRIKVALSDDSECEPEEESGDNEMSVYDDSEEEEEEVKVKPYADIKEIDSSRKYFQWSLAQIEKLYSRFEKHIKAKEEGWPAGDALKRFAKEEGITVETIRNKINNERVKVARQISLKKKQLNIV